MNIGIYQSAASLSALERWQSVVTQNITSSSVSGYKKRVVDVFSENLGSYNPSMKGNSGDEVAAQFPSVAYGINFQPGELAPTRRDYDMGIQGKGFFVLNKDGEKVYTRDGSFRIRNDRVLTSGDGAEVMSASGTPIQSLPTGGPIVVNHDGSIYQGDALLGKLQVVQFADTSKLMPVAGGYKSLGQDPIPVEKPEVLQGYLEGSNVSSMREMVDLMTIARAYEANQKVISNQDSLLGKALEKLG